MNTATSWGPRGSGRFTINHGDTFHMTGNYDVYSYVEKKPTDPIAFTLEAKGLTRREATTMASRIRQNGGKAAVFSGNVARSCF